VNPRDIDFNSMFNRIADRQERKRKEAAMTPGQRRTRDAQRAATKRYQLKRRKQSAR